MCICIDTSHKFEQINEFFKEIPIYKFININVIYKFLSMYKFAA